MKIPDSGGARSATWGYVGGGWKSKKIRKISGAKKVVSRYPKHLISSQFSLRGRFFEKKAKKNARRGWSHGQQHKPWEPCACFPDYGRGQALTPSNKRYASSRPNHMLCRIDSPRPSKKIEFWTAARWVHREIFKRPKNCEDSSDFDDFETKKS